MCENLISQLDVKLDTPIGILKINIYIMPKWTNTYAVADPECIHSQ